MFGFGFGDLVGQQLRFKHMFAGFPLAEFGPAWVCGVHVYLCMCFPCVGLVWCHVLDGWMDGSVVGDLVGQELRFIVLSCFSPCRV